MYSTIANKYVILYAKPKFYNIYYNKNFKILYMDPRG